MGTTTAGEGVVALLRQAQQALAAVADSISSLPQLPVGELLEAAHLAAGVARLSDLTMVRTTHAVEAQCRRADPEDSLAARHGLRDGAALVIALTGASRRTLQRWRQAGAVTMPRGVGSTGVLPASLPHLAQVFSAGAVSLDQALAIRQPMIEASGRAHPNDADAAERALVAAALGRSPDDDTPVGDGGWAGMPLSPELLGVQARAWRDAIDPDGPEPGYEHQRKQRSFTFGRRGDGMWTGTLLLPPEQGEAVRLALDAHNAPRSSIRYGDGPASASSPDDGGDIQPSDAIRTADSLGAGLTRRGQADDRTTSQRQADTVVGLITRAMELADAPRIGGEAATVVVTISQSELHEHARTGAGSAYLERSGETVPAHVAARIMCDGYLQACVLGDDGLPLRLGRARRSHTRHQRRAILTAYPGGCQNPGCEAPAGFTEIHHPIWWSDDGETDTDNGIPLCQHCHTEVHAGRLRCVREPGGLWRVVASLLLRSRLSWAA